MNESMVNRRFFIKLIQVIPPFLIMGLITLLLFNLFRENKDIKNEVLGFEIFCSYLIAIIGFIILSIIILTLIMYLIPYKISFFPNKLFLIFLIRKKYFDIDDIKEIHDHGRRKNLTGELFIVLKDNKKYDLHWLSPDIQDRILYNYNIPILKKDPIRKYREDKMKERKRDRIRP